MSIGAPSNLGTLLVQRLDAVLGTTLGQQANIASGAGPQAVPSQPVPKTPARCRIRPSAIPANPSIRPISKAASRPPSARPCGT